VVTNPTERELVRQQISFYASTPSYQPVLTAHGWEEIGKKLRELSRAGKWMEMPALISDEMVETYAAVAAPEDLAAALKERYRGIADRINLYLPFLPGERDEFWRTLCQEMNG
jgi:alkanesulfonate monooxygenase SsuD/methylene tetrahydromethanopterin reductase-like flavin-dependent oxidoreductase (luciferase family)